MKTPGVEHAYAPFGEISKSVFQIDQLHHSMPARDERKRHCVDRKVTASKVLLQGSRFHLRQHARSGVVLAAHSGDVDLDVSNAKRDRSKPLDVSQFYDILDELAGIKKSDLDSPDESDLDDVEPVPLSEGMIDRAVEQLHRLRAAEHQQAQRKSWWRRRAAMFPIGISVFLLAAVPVYYFVWSRWVLVV